MHAHLGRDTKGLVDLSTLKHVRMLAERSSEERIMERQHLERTDGEVRNVKRKMQIMRTGQFERCSCTHALWNYLGSLTSGFEHNRAGC